MDLTDLRHFVTTAEHMHFGLAAEQMGITQPALSQRVKALEARLGVLLFDRTKRAIQLTAAGKVFLGEARRLITDADRAMRLAKAAADGMAGELHIGYGGSVIFEPKLCGLLQDFQKAYPDASLLMHECKVEEQLDRVNSGQLDIAVLWGPLGPAYPELRKVVLSRASLAVVLRRDHPLAGRDEIHLDEVRTESFISLMDPPGIGIGHAVDRAFEAANLTPRTVLRVSSCGFR